jgi:hypothetical protein
VPETFLSDKWFEEVAKIRAELGDPEGTTALSDLQLNIVVVGGPEGDKEVHLEGGDFARGLVDGAPTKLTVPYDVAKAMFVEGNPQAAMQAFMSGQIKVEGDMSKLMAMQGGGGMGGGAGQQQFQERLRAITA